MVISDIQGGWLAHKPRPRGTVVDTVVLHATAGTGMSGAIATLRKVGYGYHYLIADGRETGGDRWRDGEVVRCVPVQFQAAHAGNSYGPHEQARGESRRQGPDAKFTSGCSVNAYSIGVSFDNLNDGVQPITEAQTVACIELLRQLRRELPTLRWVTTHAIVSPRRKSDPRLVDLERIARETGLAVWFYGARLDQSPEPVAVASDDDRRIVQLVADLGSAPLSAVERAAYWVMHRAFAGRIRRVRG